MPQHVIKRLTFRLHFPVRDRAVQLEHEIVHTYHHRIEPLLDECFSRLGGADTEYRIECLELDLGNIRPANLAAELPLRISQELAKIADNGQVRAAETLSGQERQFSLLRYFIETGSLPWWAGKLDRPALEQLVEQLCTRSPAEFRRVMAQLFTQADAVRRLVKQFSDACLSRIGRLYLSANEVSLAVLWLRDAEALFAEPDRRERVRRDRPSRGSPARGPASGALLSGDEDKSAAVSDRPGRDYATGASGRLRGPVPGTDRLREQYWLHVLSGLVHGTAGGFSPGNALQETLVSLAGGNHGVYRRLLAALEEAARAPGQPAREFSTSLPDLIRELNAGISAASADDAAGDVPGGRTRKKPPDVQETASTPRTPARDPFTDTDEDYIDNAGLVIVWPYLPRFFVNLGLAQGNGFIDDSAAERAVLLLQYLVAPHPEIPESLLSLNKLLCGLDLQRPLPAECTPTERELEECDALLRALQLHWNVVANLSADRIRTDFLQREGVLRPCAGNWQLQVENQVQDVLVKRLPWPIGVVKLPWMDYAILVHWG